MIREKDPLKKRVLRNEQRLKRVARYEAGRRKKRLPFVCLRCELPSSGRSYDLPGLDSFGARLELYFHPVEKKWGVYSIPATGTTPAGDFMCLELKLEGAKKEYRAPGQWVIDKLKACDTTRAGSIDKKHAQKKWVQKIESIENEAIDYKVKTRRECVHANNLAIASAWLGRISVMPHAEKELVRARPGTKRIWGGNAERRRKNY